MSERVLILGANGRFGRNAAEQFERAGWEVRRFDRGRDDLQRCADAAEVIVNGWNPLYPDWAALVPGLHGQVIAAARRSGSTVLVPGNVYVFGADTPGPWSEASPHLAQNPLGRIRIGMEAAYRRSRVRTVILRAGDFLDTRPSGNWFDQVMARRLAKGAFIYPGNPDLAHAWAFLPDLCRAAVALAGMRDSLPAFADIPFPGHTATGRDLAAELGRVTGREIRLKRMSWLPLRMVRPVWPMARHLLEMRYLWDTAHRLDGRLLGELLPRFRTTPLRQALASAVQHVVPVSERPAAGAADQTVGNRESGLS